VLKGWVEKLLKELGAQKLRFVAEKANPAYHPGRCAKVYAGGVEIGVLGQIHPLVAANYGVDAEIYCAELKFDALNETMGALPVYKPLPRFPSVTRDIAVVCKADITVGDMIDCILSSGGQYLKDCAVFDVYTGSHVMTGMKSVAFSLTMRSDDQTLTDDHAEETVAKVLKALGETLGAVMR
jgi:phenylalanyl-tRNA synthetase beta chain